MRAVICKKLNLAPHSEKIERAHLSNLKVRKQSAGKPPALDSAILHAPLQNSAVTSAIEGGPAGPTTCVPGSFW
jgi:hypothetical protein